MVLIAAKESDHIHFDTESDFKQNKSATIGIFYIITYGTYTHGLVRLSFG